MTEEENEMTEQAGTDVAQVLRYAPMSTTTTTTPHPVALARARRGMTQQALADATGIHRTTIVRLENRDHPPTLRTLVRIAEVLGVDDVEDLMEQREVGTWHGEPVTITSSGAVQVGDVVLAPRSINFRADLVRWLRRRGVQFEDD